MRKAAVYSKGIFAGYLTETNEGLYEFEYDNSYLSDKSQSAVSLTLPKSEKIYTSEKLFSFFVSLLSEGANREMQCKFLKIDEDDDFGLLLATAHTDTIGAITVKAI
ncbi:phosphatidylinositol kinase [Marinilabiliaceae bacterium JC040]|nr:phosphatidylinositol kinase [Marinilabiliaceae bacterium JC040]